MSQTVTRQLALAETHFRSGNVGAAEKLLRDVLAHEPSNSKASELMAYIAGNRGEMEYLFELLKTATSDAGASGEAFYYLGKHYLERELFENAVTAYRQSLQRSGDFAEGLHDLGAALAGCGKPESALPLYDKVLAMHPDSYQTWFNKGVALDDLRHFDEAVQNYDKALSINPGFAVAWYNRGATLNDLGRYDEALASHEKAIALDPNYAEAWSNRGATLAALRRYKEALGSHEKALTLKPDFAEAWARGGAVLAELKYPDKALANFAKALALKPDIPYVFGNWLRARMDLCQWEVTGANSQHALSADPGTKADLEQQFEKLLSGIDAKRKVSTPFVALAITSTVARQRLCGEVYSRDRYPAFAASTADVRTAARDQHARIKIGYFSPDFRAHAVFFLTAGMFEHHDRARFEVHAFALDTTSEDSMTGRLKSACEYFHDVREMSDQNITLLARNLGIDIAVDLAGHTGGARTGILSQRAAPIQMQYLGFPGTMGAPFIDYIIGDERVIPDSDISEYSEKVVFLPHCFQVNDAKRDIAHAPARSFCGLDDGAFVFCSFNNSYKLNPGTFKVWMNLLRSTDRSVLWLIGENDIQIQNLRNWAAARGVSPQRLVFASRLPYAEHLARYQLADLVLDTLPFNGGTTTSDALWGGAPVLTCTGKTFAGRMTTSLLHAIGLDELITQTLEEYQTKALHLANSPSEALKLKKKLAANRGTYPLFDTQLCTRHMEAAYTEMWRRHQSGLPPDHLRIPPLQSIHASSRLLSPG